VFWRVWLAVFECGWGVGAGVVGIWELVVWGVVWLGGGFAVGCRFGG